MAGGRTVCVLVFLMLLSDQALPQTSDSVMTAPLRMQPGDLDFRLYQDYLIVAKGNLGDLKNQNLLVDTGSDHTIVDRRVAGKLQLKLERARVSTIRRDVDAWRTVLPACQVGPMTCRNYIVFVQDLSFLERGLGARIDAIIGLDLLSSLSFTIDYQTNRIFFRTTDSIDHQVAFESDPAPLVTVMTALNGKAKRLLVDTGASCLMLFNARWSPEPEQPEGTFFLRPKQVTRRSSSMGGELTRQMIALKTTLLGGTDLGLRTAFLVDVHGTTEKIDGVFNPAAIGFKKVSFDFEHNKLGWNAK